MFVPLKLFMSKHALLLILVGCSFFASAQDKPRVEKKYQVAIIGFYNLENFYDTVNNPQKNDEEFLPAGANHYTGAVYNDKLSKLSDVISLIGSDITPDGLAMMGCAEIENDTVLNDLIHTPKLKSRGYKIVHYDSPDVRGVDVGLLYNPKYFTPKFSEPLFVPLFEPDGAPRY